MPHQVELRRARQSTLLGRRDAGTGTTTGLAATQAHCDEDDFQAFLHDQVNLAKPAAIVTFQQYQPLLLQPDGGKLFCCLAPIVQ